MAQLTVLMAGLLFLVESQASDMGDRSTLYGFLSKYIHSGSDVPRSSMNDYAKFMIPNLHRFKHGNGLEALSSHNTPAEPGPNMGISPFSIVGDKPSLHPTTQVQDSISSLAARGEPSISTKDFNPPTIADREEKQALQKLVTNDSSNPITLSAIGMGLLSLVTMLGVRLRRRLQPATVLDSSGGRGPLMPMTIASAQGENVLEMKSQDPKINDSAAASFTNCRSDLSWRRSVSSTAGRAIGAVATAAGCAAAGGCTAAPFVAPMERASQSNPLGELLKCTKRGMGLVWDTGRSLTCGIAAGNFLMGVLPGLRAAVTKRVIDAVVLGMPTGTSQVALAWLGVEAVLIVAISATRRAQCVAESFLRELLGHNVNVKILKKALRLQLTDFEDSETFDKLTRARREASIRPLSLAKAVFKLFRNVISLVAYGTLLLGFSRFAGAILLIAAVPPFLAEVKFAGDAFRLAQRQTSGLREQGYLERVIAQDASAKEVKLFRLGPWLLARYCKIFDSVFNDTRRLEIRQGFFGFLLELVSNIGLYLAYGWVVIAAVQQTISLGDMTLYLLVFKEGQQALSRILTAVSDIYANNLYLSNLFDFLDQKVDCTCHRKAVAGHISGEGFRFEDVWFRYPGKDEDIIKGVSFRIPPGTRFALVGSNGTGKTTLIKLLTGLYKPTRGKILLDGLDLQEWDPLALQSRVGAIFQDFLRYELSAGANVGVGDISAIENTSQVSRAASRGMAASFIEEWPDRYQTQLGNLFEKGHDLSGGEWQKVALSRALMREDADLLVLDEPTAAMDAEAEAEIFDRLARLSANQSALLVSHRFSTVRMADRIAVLQNGKIQEEGSHEELLAHGGDYARLFSLQAKGYH